MEQFPDNIKYIYRHFLKVFTFMMTDENINFFKFVILFVESFQSDDKFLKTILAHEISYKILIEILVYLFPITMQYFYSFVA